MHLVNHIQTADGLIQHDQLWFERNRPCDVDPLQLSAAELMRIFNPILWLEADPFQ